tara:strand:+ start:2032 stop:2283 length:252 start_codon:yes stop_codon:yes gene_type:complete
MEEVYLIYGISDCPACLRAQAFLMDRDLEYVFVQSDFSSIYRESIKKEFEWQTFPIIVKLSGHQEILVGGYNELKRLLDESPQ